MTEKSESYPETAPYFDFKLPEQFRWFVEARYGLFIHWGPYAQYGRGEQVLFREHLDPLEYEQRACAWNPGRFDARQWAATTKAAGMGYACLTTRHHDGYCLWDSATTDYTSMAQAPKRDFVREYVDAFRAEGLKVGLYYSWCDFRIPAYYAGPEKDPEGWAAMRRYIHAQVEELLTRYGKIDYFFYDGVWPRCADDLQSIELLRKMRAWQPGIIVNNRLGLDGNRDLAHVDGGAGAGGDQDEGDFGTPEQTIIPEKRLWESCQVSTWRLWGYTGGERWKSAPQLLDLLCSCAARGGNLLLNVGPTGDGELPLDFTKRALAVGRWLQQFGEAVYGNDGGDLTEFITWGYETLKGNDLYLICRFWNQGGELRLADLPTPATRVELLNTRRLLPFEQKKDVLTIRGLPEQLTVADDLFPVIKVTFSERPQTGEWGETRLWGGDPQRVARWAARRGAGVMAAKDEKDT